MPVCKVVVRRRGEQDETAQREAFDLLLGAYRCDGHILGNELLTTSSVECFESYLQIPASDAFLVETRNHWIQDVLDRAEGVGLSAPEVIELGAEMTEVGACTCAAASSLILFTTYLDHQSPVRCGDCFCPVPLYRLPRFDGGEFVEVLSWQDDYKACDMLFMNSATGEKLGYREMSRADSSLSVRGRAICSHFERQLGKPVYYFLHRYYGRSASKETARRCPLCAGAWRLPNRLHNFFDFQCEKCRILSCVSAGI